MRVLYIIIAVLLTYPVVAKDIYVSKTGSDENLGTEVSPYLTISKAAGVAVAGDVVIITNGIYEETLQPANSGTSGNPITFKGKEGHKVIITAMEAVNNWTLDEGNIYKASVSWDLGQDNMAMHNDQLMDLARWPNNTPQNLFDRDFLPGCNKGAAGGNTTTLNYNGSEGNGHGNLIPHAGNWENGGSIHFYGGAGFIAWTEFVTASTANVINFNLQRNQSWIPDRHHPGYTGHGIKKGEFFLQGIKEALDYKNEWWYDKNAKLLYVQIDGGGVPADNTIRFRRRTKTIIINQNFIRIENIAVFGGEITINGSDNTLTKVSSFFGNHTLNVISGFDSGRQSVLLKGNRNTMSQCEIGWGGGNGVYDKGQDNKVLNCYIHDFNYLGNYDCVLNTRGAIRGVYKNNTLEGAGKDVIQAYVDGGEFAYNDISRSMRIADDGGLLYTTNARSVKSSIHHNWFHDARARSGRFKAAGIYLDNDSKNWDVHHNVVYNTDWTNIQINWDGTNLNIFNNTFVKGSATMGAWHKEGTAFVNVKVWNNITDKEATDQEGNQESESTWEPQSDKQNNLVSKESFVSWEDNDFTLKTGAPAIDYGRVISVYTDGFFGSMPDAGAYEYGVSPWQPGVDWDIDLGPAQDGCYDLPGESCIGESVAFADSHNEVFPFKSISVTVNYAILDDRELILSLYDKDENLLDTDTKVVLKGTKSHSFSFEFDELLEVATGYKMKVELRTIDVSNTLLTTEESFFSIVEKVTQLKETKKSIVVYPNPTNGMIKVPSCSSGWYVYDGTGRELDFTKANVIDLTGLPIGVYAVVSEIGRAWVVLQ